MTDIRKLMGEKLSEAIDYLFITVYVVNNEQVKLLRPKRANENRATFAWSRRKRDQIFINLETIRDAGFTISELRAVIAHEVGHISLNTSDEMACDKFACHFVNQVDLESARRKAYRYNQLMYPEYEIDEAHKPCYDFMNV